MFGSEVRCKVAQDASAVEWHNSEWHNDDKARIYAMSEKAVRTRSRCDRYIGNETVNGAKFNHHG
jgi:hypothetical protein